MEIKELLADAEKRHRELVAQAQALQAQQQHLEVQRQELIAEILRVEGEMRVLRSLDGRSSKEG